MLTKDVGLVSEFIKFVPVTGFRKVLVPPPPVVVVVVVAVVVVPVVVARGG